jgi:hypothetical protein
MSEWVRCHWCGERIGVYEPLIVVDEGREPRETSLARERDPGRSDGRCYHLACFAREQSGGRLTASVVFPLPLAAFSGFRGGGSGGSFGP